MAETTPPPPPPPVHNSTQPSTEIQPLLTTTQAHNIKSGPDDHPIVAVIATQKEKRTNCSCRKAPKRPPSVDGKTKLSSELGMWMKTNFKRVKDALLGESTDSDDQIDVGDDEMLEDNQDNQKQLSSDSFKVNKTTTDDAASCNCPGVKGRNLAEDSSNLESSGSGSASDNHLLGDWTHTNNRHTNTHHTNNRHTNTNNGPKKWRKKPDGRLTWTDDTRYPVANGANANGPVVKKPSCKGLGSQRCRWAKKPNGQWTYTDTDRYAAVNQPPPRPGAKNHAKPPPKKPSGGGGGGKTDWTSKCKKDPAWCKKLINDFLNHKNNDFADVPKPKVSAKRTALIAKKCHTDQKCINKATEDFKQAILRETLMERTGLKHGPDNPQDQRNKKILYCCIGGGILLLLLMGVLFWYCCGGGGGSSKGGGGATKSTKSKKGSKRGKSGKSSKKGKSGKSKAGGLKSKASKKSGKKSGKKSMKKSGTKSKR